MKTLCYTHCLFMLFCGVSFCEEAATPPDRLGEALALVGFSRDDLGYRPKGYWSRFPNPKHIPHKLPFFDDLFAEPLRVYDFTKTMANATRDYLSPKAVAEKKDALFRLVYFLGVDRKLVGFRGYSANLAPEVDEREPMLKAFEKLYSAAGRRLDYMSFGKKADWPDPKSELLKQLKSVDVKLQKPMAALILNILDAYQWRRTAMRNVRPETAQRMFRIYNINETQTDAQSYDPEIDDVARDLDELSLYYAAQKAVQAADDARREFSKLVKDGDESLKLDGLHFEFLSPIGRVVLAGTRDDNHAYKDCAILVDLGGNDHYSGPAGATPRLDIPISVAIDCSGDDVYETDSGPSQGAGILGAGVLVDVSGKDKYKAKSFAQGVGLFGLGLLADLDGDDSYALEYSGQGAGYFGLGFNFDVRGNDKYYLYGDGQGFGGTGGVGVLANFEGDDNYVAEALAEKAGRSDYHSQHKISVSNAQGVGAGRRGDGADGHCWAGGLGAIIDISGNDTYESGNWSLGTGYWFGAGLVYDGSGDDLYRSVYFTQASGAHFCIGAIVDEGGNDRHILYETAGAGIAFGWDFTNALLIDKGGNDYYEAKIISIGLAQIRSNALLIDIGGDDKYVLGAGQQGLGAATFRESYRRPSYKYGPYSFYANSFGLLLDIGGNDQYLEWNVKTNERKASAKRRNNKTWLSPEKGRKTYGYRNFGVGMDVEGGTAPELYLFDDKGD